MPRRLGPVLWLNQALPFRVRVALAHVTKADDVLRHIDAGERESYNQRIGRRPERHLVAVTAPAAVEEGVEKEVNTRHPGLADVAVTHYHSN